MPAAKTKGKKTTTKDCRQKARQINEDPSIYGTFAEIGAGQEVVRHFFKAGLSSQTIAKSMSAYDMTFSDAIYGKEKNGRYVCLPRLQKILDHEYTLLKKRLGQTKSSNTKFFVYGNTVATGFPNGHGWMGVRFQIRPEGPIHRIRLHLRLFSKDVNIQQETIGLVGVNLIYAAFNHTRSPEKLLASLVDGIKDKDFEIDMISFHGPEYEKLDPRLMCLLLVKLGLANATMFSSDGHVQQPSEVIYKKPVIVQRGNFRPVTHVNVDMLSCALKRFKSQKNVVAKDVIPIMEVTLSNLLQEGQVNVKDFLDRATVLQSLGYHVMISNYAEYYRLITYISKLTNQPIALALGISNLEMIFQASYYKELEGGILEAFGKLFRKQVKMYVHPKKDVKSSEIITVENLTVSRNQQSLLTHLKHNRLVETLDNYNPKYLHIYSKQVLKMIRSNDRKWLKMVPQNVAALIRKKKLFGYKPE